MSGNGVYIEYDYGQFYFFCSYFFCNFVSSFGFNTLMHNEAQVVLII
jgi:hypothetical protein